MILEITIMQFAFFIGIFMYYWIRNKQASKRRNYETARHSGKLSNETQFDIFARFASR